MSKWKKRPSTKLCKVDWQPGLAQFVTMEDRFRNRISANLTSGLKANLKKIGTTHHRRQLAIRFDASPAYLVSEVDSRSPKPPPRPPAPGKRTNEPGIVVPICLKQGFALCENCSHPVKRSL
jgi:hypothetical protein